MSRTYAIGDLQGCFTTFQALLERLKFRPGRDRLWLAGDLVNRGPDSLATLRWLVEHADSVTAVLGNHDLALLNVVLGDGEFRKGKDTFHDVLDAGDKDALISWLRSRPLVHRSGSFAMVHAGLLPQWTLKEAEGLSREFQSAMTGRASSTDLLERMFSDVSRQWEEDSKNRVATAANILTRIRVCTLQGKVIFDFSGTPDEAPDGHYPWFLVPGRRSLGPTVLFGHWSALGHRLLPGFVALDSGCVWGNRLTAYCLETGKIVQQDSLDG